MKIALKARKFLAGLILLAFLALFVRFDSFSSLSILTQIQLIPALISGGMLTVLAIILITLFTGRIYCSLLCPLGLIQDLMARVGRIFRKNGPGFLAPRFFLHIILAGLTATLAIIGFMPALAICEPFALAGRLMTNLVQPVLSYLMWLVGYGLEGANWFNKARVNPVDSHSVFIVATIATALFLVVLRFGRIYCNLFCPLGALLRVLASFSVFRLQIDGTGCTGCGKCARNCKAGCIDLEKRQIDFSRCVVCLNCIDSCSFNAIALKPGFGSNRTDFSPERRALIGSAATAAITTLLPIALPAPARAANRILPPGAGNSSEFAKKCISCHLCISACPSAIITVAVPQFAAGSLAQPELKFTRGMCEQTCNVCTTICPTGAIAPVSLEEKKTLKIAEVEYIKKLCVVETDGKDCGACAEHCPTKAVKMVPYRNNLMIPEVDPGICIGCGSCEHICPVRPQKAIFVNPIEQQHHIKLPEAKPLQDAGPLEDFPF
ncbi:MAG: 4Fe-4S dicluster domain-containing protein [Candidatus Riflebacteria bacterium]